MEEKSEKSVIIEHLTKNFQIIEKKAGLSGSISSLISPQKKQIQALKDISFTLKEGELVGFIGPNGAGKTTTLKILSGLLYPTDGFVQVLTFDPWDRKPEFLKQISLVMGQKNQLWWDLPAIDTFELNRAMYEIPRKKYEESLRELVTLLDVENLLTTQVRKLSLGQRMRLELVAALLHQPKILFLDEPTLGLDIIAQQKVRNFISDYNRRNKATIILTSHNMSDLMDMAKRVIVINNGGILFDGNLKELISDYAREKVIRLYLSQETDLKKFEEIGNVRKVEFPQVVLTVRRETAAIAAAELLQNFPIADLTIEEEPIEEVIKRVFNGEKNLTNIE